MSSPSYKTTKPNPIKQTTMNSNQTSSKVSSNVSSKVSSKIDKKKVQFKKKVMTIPYRYGERYSVLLVSQGHISKENSIEEWLIAITLCYRPLYKFILWHY